MATETSSRSCRSTCDDRRSTMDDERSEPDGEDEYEEEQQAEYFKYDATVAPAHLVEGRHVFVRLLRVTQTRFYVILDARQRLRLLRHQVCHGREHSP